MRDTPLFPKDAEKGSVPACLSHLDGRNLVVEISSEIRDVPGIGFCLGPESRVLMNNDAGVAEYLDRRNAVLELALQLTLAVAGAHTEVIAAEICVHKETRAVAGSRFRFPKRLPVCRPIAPESSSNELILSFQSPR